ncbi:flagellar basal body rod protein FlgB [Caulobacter sp. SLTY]|uniref:flagellar basal body rod protein FlgB n=1 Tax=Caulobacter sp. SLTY TaxID=2683262 RepID=UPI003211E668
MFTLLAMNIGDIPLFSMLRSRLGYLSDRQNVIAENIANANTPGFVARDVAPFTFESQLRGQAGGLGMMQPAQTQAGHMAAAPRRASAQTHAKPRKTGDSEVTLNGNAVVLEDQMIKMTETRMQYDAAIGFYQKSMALLRMAARAPGR